MHVFVTGASGFVGSGVTRQLLAAGHAVTGLARSDRSAAAIEAMGAGVRRGDLDDLDALRAGAREADTVVHTAFVHDFSNYAASVGADKAAIEAMGAELAGKPLIATAGLGIKRTGPFGTEDDVADVSRVPRLSEPSALGLLEAGVKAMVMRLPPTVHGPRDHGFIAGLIAIARDKGRSAYVGDGGNVWAAVHRDDAASAYVLALEKGVAGARYHAVAEPAIRFADIAAKIGEKLGVPVVSVSRDEARAQFGWMADFAQFDTPATSTLTQQRLGWRPRAASLLEDMQSGTYFD